MSKCQASIECPRRKLIKSQGVLNNTVVYFVCGSASEFGAMGSTSFLGFSYPNLLLVFSEHVIFRNLYHIFLASVGTFSGSFLFYFYFSVPYFGLYSL